MHTLITSTRTTTEHGAFIRLSERYALLQKLRPNILRRSSGGCSWGREARRVRGEGRDGGERGEVAQLMLGVCNEIISGGLERYELLSVRARTLRCRGST